MIAATSLTLLIISYAIVARVRGLPCPCLTLATAAGVTARLAAVWIRWPPGKVGRRAIAFFVTFTAVATVLTALSYRDTVDRFVADLKSGGAFSSLTGGIMVAGCIEVAFVPLAFVCPSIEAVHTAGPTDNLGVAPE